MEEETNIPVGTEGDGPCDEETGRSDPATHVPSSTSADKNDQLDFENRPFHDFIGKEPKEYGARDNSDDEMEIGHPAENEDLPDLYRYLKTIREGDTDLESDREPQSLFNRPEHLEQYKSISTLKYRVDNSEVKPYVEDFENVARDDVLMIANISLEEIQEEEMRMRDEYIRFQKQEEEAQNRRKSELNQAEKNTKKRNHKDMKDKRRQLARLVEIAKQKENLQMDLLQRSFERAEHQLKDALQQRQKEVKRMFGDLKAADGEFGGTGGKRWKVDWDKAPQPIQVKLKTLRGVRDKLPGGRYVVMVSLYNRLGGHLMHWSKLKGQQWGGATLPVTHDGNYYNSEIKINQSVFTVLPDKPGVRPGMIVTFEVYLLKGDVINTDRVVAWGCFPICDGTFEVVEGKYKTPMVRGEMDFKLDKHSQIERIISSDLDHWLCNAYFEIVRLPRYMAGQKEYEVELQFSSALVNHPDRINLDGEEYKDSENPILGSAIGSHSHMADSVSELNSVGKTTTNKTSSYKSSSDNEDTESTLSMKKSTTSEALFRPARTINRGAAMHNSSLSLPHTEGGAAADRKFTLDESTDSDADVDEDDMFILKKGKEEFKPVADNLGLFYKRHLNNPVDIYTKKLYSVLPKSNRLSRKRQKRKLTYAEELEQHTASVKPPFSEKGRIAERGWKRVSYLSRMFMAELGLSQWASREFWAMLFLFIFTFFMRFYLHYTAQYLFLKVLKIPVNSFNFQPYTVHLNYQSSLLHPLQEALLVLLGPLFILVLFTLWVIICWICQVAIGMFPDIGSKFVLMFGIQSIFNPIFLMIVDACQQTYNYNTMTTAEPIADFAKMYWVLVRTQGSGYGGIFITVFLYLFIMFASGAILYMYFLRLHNNGRMLDIYWRLHSQEEDVFVPYDLEVSLQELEYICIKAEQWRGEEGARRKVAVYDYVWEEEDTQYSAFDETIEPVSKSQKKKEKTSHIAIHTLHTDGLRELFRHFLVLPDGAIVEVLGEMSVPGMTKEVKKAINSGTSKVEKLMDFGSSSSLNKSDYSRSIATANSVATASKIKVRGRFHSGDASSLRTPVTGRAVHVSVDNLKHGSAAGRPGPARPSSNSSDTGLSEDKKVM